MLNRSVATPSSGQADRSNCERSISPSVSQVQAGAAGARSTLAACAWINFHLRLAIDKADVSKQHT